MPSTTQVAIGSVVSLWRHPVKSMMGEELNATEVTERGLLGDRAYALVDSSDGKVASAKNPRKWPNLFDFRAAFIEPPRSRANVPPVRITLPDGSIASSQQSDLNQVLSKALNRKVTFIIVGRISRARTEMDLVHDRIASLKRLMRRDGIEVPDESTAVEGHAKRKRK